MPHIVVEYSATAEISGVINALQKCLFDAALSTGLFSEKAIKVRSMAFENYFLPEERSGFIHINNKILSGRTTEQKQLLANVMLDALTRFNLSNTAMSVEVSDLHKESYVKT